jgi:phosphotransferase system HPr (HPr) family protein
MSSQTLQRKVVITNPQGLHVRPLAAFVRQAMQFQSTITLSKGDRRANGKSALELLSLGVAQGQEVLLEVSGSDAPVALQVLADLLAAPSVDDEPEA